MKQPPAEEDRASDAARSLQRRLAAHVAGGMTTDLGPSTMTVAASEYTDEARFAAECRNIFRDVPLLACLSTDLPEPGSTQIFDHAGPSVLIVRNASGGVDAFLNMCPHRGTRLVSECGTHRRFICPFHAWTFGIDGRLRTIPGEKAFDDLQRASRNLIRVPCAEWNGLVFVKARAGEEPLDLDSFLDSFADELAMIDFRSFSRVKADRIDVAANWKSALDTYFECYHFATLHKGNLADLYLTDVMVHDAFEPHARVVYTSRDYCEFATRAEETWPEKTLEAVHLLFPNTSLNVYDLDGARYVGLYSLYPGASVGQAFSTMTTYAPTELPGNRSRAEWEQAHDWIVNTVRNEDYPVASAAWRNLAEDRSGFRLVFGRNEQALQALHRNLARYSRMPLD